MVNMVNLQAFKAKICYTSAGYLIHQQKVLLVKHKKLGIWLAPGGHMEPNELPHQAAEREFWEETGIKVTAINPDPKFEFVSHDSQFLPAAIISNLHWVSQENYQNRLISRQPDKRQATDLWPKGCEQHICFVYLVAAVDDLDFKQNLEETDGIGWFSLAEVAQLETTEDIKQEAAFFLNLT